MVKLSDLSVQSYSIHLSSNKPKLYCYNKPKLYYVDIFYSLMSFNLLMQ